MTTPDNTNQDSAATATTWEVDPNASQVEFTAGLRLLFVANMKVKGRFSDVQGTFIGDEHQPTNANIEVTIGSASLDTRSAARDKHLRSADFFEVERYPHLTFTSQRIEALDPVQGHYLVTGLLTIRGVTREVNLDAWQVPETTAAEKTRHVFNLTTMLNRRDFGLVWSRPTQQIADEVNITLHIEVTPAPSPV
ncbi:MAG: YceI family protein [Ktedonobacterales bacterium]